MRDFWSQVDKNADGGCWLGVSQRRLAVEYGVSPTVISHIRTGKAWAETGAH